MCVCDLKCLDCEYYFKASDAPDGTEDCHWLPNTDVDVKPCEDDM